MKNRTVRMAIAAIALAFAGLGAASVPASASIGQCPSGSWCYWSGANYSSTFYGFPNSGNTGLIAVRSFYNNSSSGRGVNWYSGANHTGVFYGCTSPFFGSGSWNVVASSHQFNPTAGGGCPF